MISLRERIADAARQYKINTPPERRGLPPPCPTCAEKRRARMRADIAGGKRKLILSHRLSPGDVMVMTALVRDLVKAFGNELAVDVDTPYPDLWLNNPYLTHLPRPENFQALAAESSTLSRAVMCDHATVLALPQSWDRAWPSPATAVLHLHYHDQEGLGRSLHYLEGWTHYVESKLGLRVPITDIKPDIHLSNEEKSSKVAFEGPYWAVDAGCKADGPNKVWPYYQEVVDATRNRIRWVQIGERHQWHPRLNHVEDMIGKTTLRQLLILVSRAAGVLSPVSLPVHVAAAFDKPAVVIAGSNEPPYWAAYRKHQTLHNDGAFSCGCWRYAGCPNTVPFPNPLRQRPFETDTLPVPRCRAAIRPVDVLTALERLGAI